MRRMGGLAASIAGLAAVFAACSPAMPGTGATPEPTATAMGAMGSMTAPADTTALAPAVRGFYRGGDVFFIHTEASDPQVAAMLTRMMGPQVVLVPSLAQVPEPVLAPVYVFTNGVRGDGPFGFQPDVFTTVPGDPLYTPLRGVHLVTWRDGATPRELHSAEEVEGASSSGEVTVQRPGAVVNMPILVWPGGRR